MKFKLLQVTPRRDTVSHFVILLPILIAVVLTLTTDGFLTTTNLSNLIPQATPLLILSLGLMFPVLTGGIDISNGALVSVIAAILVTTTNQFFGVCLGLCVALLTGLANGIGVTFSGCTPLL